MSVGRPPIAATRAFLMDGSSRERSRRACIAARLVPCRSLGRITSYGSLRPRPLKPPDFMLAGAAVHGGLPGVTPAWAGTSAVVSRAMRLIAEGALDRGSVGRLAGRVGIGSRHLRRLFVQHLGASPIRIATTRRVHFARNLIEETDLPLTELAACAGFRSIRQFNQPRCAPPRENLLRNCAEYETSLLHRCRAPACSFVWRIARRSIGPACLRFWRSARSRESNRFRAMPIGEPLKSTAWREPWKSGTTPRTPASFWSTWENCRVTSPSCR